MTSPPRPPTPPTPPASPPPLPPDRLTDDVRDEARRAIEAIVLVSEQPMASNLLGQLLELRPALVDELCHQLAAEYEEQGRGFELVRVAGGWRFQSHPAQAPYVERFVLEGQSGKLSAAALETLAIVAYKQPISRAQVASIRGVSVDGVMRTLQQRGYIAEVGRDPGPGQATMFGTTGAFLERLGVDSLTDLPALGAFVPGADVVEQLERGLRPDGPTAPDMADLTDATMDALAPDTGDATDGADGPPPDDPFDVGDAPAGQDGSDAAERPAPDDPAAGDRRPSHDSPTGDMPDVGERPDLGG
ncbi:MAG TPA: SMC-Scp complex subunit ScpB [Acidimicrobiales bacterium]|jgi:segregation and condensation protein B|nr:SMC-Scp complex subunit ScpB [Acidimicrobiales bacterium]